MPLFEMMFDKNENILPYDGIVTYHGKIFNQEQSAYYFQKLLNYIEWRNDEAIMFGKRIITRRKAAWYGDTNYEYTYSKIKKYALPWTEVLIKIKEKIELESGETYNSCLLNLYHNGEEGMAYHSDGEPDLKKEGAIASVSFGAERKFSFKHKTTQEKVDINLEDGSFLLMKGATQKYWLHRLPPSKKIKDPRINLTFRTIIQ